MIKNSDSFYYHVDPKKDTDYTSEDAKKLKKLKSKEQNDNQPTKN